MVEFITSANNLKGFPNDFNDVVFVGRSNVGKSSLLNSLYNQKIAYVGKKPGMTKMINFFNVEQKYYAVDVPGYGFANRSGKELIAFSNMMEDYFSQDKKIKLVVMIVDVRHKPTKDDIDMLEFLRYHHLKVVVVANKIDKISNNELQKNLKLISEVLKIDKNYIITTSTLKRKGINELKNYIEACVIESTLI